MSHYCWHCQSFKSNESFSGGGHKSHLCKACRNERRRTPKDELEKASRFLEMASFLWRQSRISRKNLKRLAELAASPIEDIASAASLIGQIGRVYPGRRKRIGKLARSHPELVAKLVQYGFLEPLEEWVEEDDEVPVDFDSPDDHSPVGDPDYDCDPDFPCDEFLGADEYLCEFALADSDNPEGYVPYIDPAEGCYVDPLDIEEALGNLDDWE